MAFTYNPAIPQPGDFPSDSQSQLLGNFEYLAGVAGKGLLRDHQMTLLSSNGNDGIHKQVTLNNQATPGFSSAASVIYANLANGQSQIFFNNAAGDVQLTSVKASVPTLATNGVTFLPGGLLLQWGQSTGTWNGGANVIVFPVAYGATPYSITANQVFAASSIREFVQVDFSGTNASQWRPILVLDGGGVVGTPRTICWMSIGLA